MRMNPKRLPRKPRAILMTQADLLRILRDVHEEKWFRNWAEVAEYLCRTRVSCRLSFHKPPCVETLKRWRKEYGLPVITVRRGVVTSNLLLTAWLLTESFTARYQRSRLVKRWRHLREQQAGKVSDNKPASPRRRPRWWRDPRPPQVDETTSLQHAA